MPAPSTFADALARLRRGGTNLVARAGIERAGRVTAPHRHPEGQLFGATRGVLTVGTDAGLWVVPASHAVWVPPHQRHSLRSHGPFDGCSVYIAESACAGLPGAPCAIRCGGLLREAIARAASWDARAHDAPRRRIADVILDEIRAAQTEAPGLPLPVDARLMKIARALLADLSDARGLEHWAAQGAVSVRTLSRRFVAETGLTFADWRQRARLMRAIELLAAGTPVTTVALSLGYDNVSAFIAMFRRAHGVTPARWRDARA
ncbi:MAG TPA: helix-turn-helix transcriptional regulator [Burkholderiaceae bacterium]